MFTRLSSLLRLALRRHGLEPAVVAAQVLDTVNQSLRKRRLGDRARALRFAGGQVTIEVDHPTTARVVREDSAAILAEVRSGVAQAAVEGFRFTTRPPPLRSPC